MVRGKEKEKGRTSAGQEEPHSAARLRRRCVVQSALCRVVARCGSCFPLRVGPLCVFLLCAVSVFLLPPNWIADADTHSAVLHCAALPCSLSSLQSLLKTLRPRRRERNATHCNQQQQDTHNTTRGNTTNMTTHTSRRRADGTAAPAPTVSSTASSPSLLRLLVRPLALSSLFVLIVCCLTCWARVLRSLLLPTARRWRAARTPTTSCWWAASPASCCPAQATAHASPQERGMEEQRH